MTYLLIALREKDRKNRMLRDFVDALPIGTKGRSWFKGYEGKLEDSIEGLHPDTLRYFYILETPNSKDYSLKLTSGTEVFPIKDAKIKTAYWRADKPKTRMIVKGDPSELKEAHKNWSTICKMSIENIIDVMVSESWEFRRKFLSGFEWSSSRKLHPFMFAAGVETVDEKYLFRTTKIQKQYGDQDILPNL
jgi:hypothetical protein